MNDMTDFASIKKGLTIGGQTVSLPLIQGGMGVGISLSGLAGAVAGAGGVGVISTAQIGFDQEGWDASPVETNLKAIGTHIRRARRIMEEKQSRPPFAGRVVHQHSGRTERNRYQNKNIRMNKVHRSASSLPHNYSVAGI